MTCVGVSKKLREKAGVGRTEGGPYFAVVTLDLERGLEVLDGLWERGSGVSVREIDRGKGGG